MPAEPYLDKYIASSFLPVTAITLPGNIKVLTFKFGKNPYCPDKGVQTILFNSSGSEVLFGTSYSITNLFDARAYLMGLCASIRLRTSCRKYF